MVSLCIEEAGGYQYIRFHGKRSIGFVCGTIYSYRGVTVGYTWCIHPSVSLGKILAC